MAGSISYLYYANRVFQLPLALFAIATSVALFPRVARYLKKEDEAQALHFMKKAFWFLAFVLTASTLGGFILAEEITWLLFERGAFTLGGFILAEEITWLLFERGAFVQSDTQHTAVVLQMYMMGLLPFGLAKVFSLWLYARQEQMKAARIATFALASYTLFALALIYPMGAAGLALASTISGFVSFSLTLRAFGRANFLAILSRKFMAYLVVSALLFAALLVAVKELLHAYL
jgi:putative peptidoglycan lipid II flippase